MMSGCFMKKLLKLESLGKKGSDELGFIPTGGSSEDSIRGQLMRHARGSWATRGPRERVAQESRPSLCTDSLAKRGRAPSGVLSREARCAAGVLLGGVDLELVKSAGD